MRKPAYKPLFQPNTFVDVDENSINQIFNEGNNTPPRRRLASHLRLFLNHLKSLGLESFEMWIDGSFTTINPEPKDIDVVCFISWDQLAAMSVENQEKLAYMASEEGRVYVRERWNIDYYHCPFDSIADRNLWKIKFFKDEFGTEKGIGRIKI